MAQDARDRCQARGRRPRAGRDAHQAPPQGRHGHVCKPSRRQHARGGRGMPRRGAYAWEPHTPFFILNIF